MKEIDSYRIINIIFAGVIGLVFIYSCLFLPENGRHIIPSIYTDITCNASPSLGLSRAFSALVRGQVSLANQFNPYALNIFAFFCFQFLYRLISLRVDSQAFISKRKWIRIDIILSISLFFFAFYPLIQFTLQTVGEVFRSIF
ncbi:hypothetical protein DWB61_01120 [Ancylomarina euxinus]|uniref:DUF2752 domain-containing protein n=1 Tax=Ancylomarina euxinus TaxID=2283627 RepID=A0A425Y869_9BACT|nr:hypothetical protein [Ancylomarina euxinus]MCZ4693486.1 hypothetical protein [Ancylomarina euxinus]MUP13713.1 hypothetical protein [Ancylomarina euxinus]RRG24648.1 hypothetical protein DWB61_01120 [Ancylomarina euxinus]